MEEILIKDAVYHKQAINKLTAHIKIARDDFADEDLATVYERVKMNHIKDLASFLRRGILSSFAKVKDQYLEYELKKLACVDSVSVKGDFIVATAIGNFSAYNLAEIYCVTAREFTHNANEVKFRLSKI